ERHEYPTGEPLYVWHTVPDHLGAEEQKHLANRAIPALLMAGYTVNCDPEVFDEALYQQAVHRLQARAARPAPQQPAPASPPSPPAGAPPPAPPGPPRPPAPGPRQSPLALRTGPPHPVSPGGPGTTPGPPTPRPIPRRNP